MSEALLRRFSLRLRIATVAILAVGAALAGGGLLLIGVLHSRLDEAATTAARLRATDVAGLAETGSLPDRLALPGEETALVQVVDADGDVIASTANVAGAAAISTVVPPSGGSSVFTAEVVRAGEADRMRVVAVATEGGVEGHDHGGADGGADGDGDGDPATGPIVVYAAESLERVDSTTSAIATRLALGLPLVALLAGAITWWAVGRALRPVRAITATMAEITATDLHRRVPTPATRDEIGQLADTVNATLGRLDTSVERQRRFVSDASHELRGPLAALRADLEISLAHPQRTEWREVAQDTLTDVDRLQHLTEDLLLLARIDARPTTPTSRVDLGAIVTEEIAHVRRPGIVATLSSVASSTDTSSTGDDPTGDDPAVIGEPTQLRRMIRNLLHNAETHAASIVEVSLDSSAGHLTLVVADDGPGVPANQRVRIFEPFVRLDEARTRDSGGTGLGLAIARDVAVSHHGSIVVTERAGGGARFEVVLPTDSAKPRSLSAAEGAFSELQPDLNPDTASWTHR